MIASSFFFNQPTPTEIYTLSLHDALPISRPVLLRGTAEDVGVQVKLTPGGTGRSEEHTSELQSHSDLVCRLLLEKKKPRTKSGSLPTSSATRARSTT